MSAHGDDTCLEPIKSVNCDGENSFRFLNYPVYKLEVATQEVRTLKKVLLRCEKIRMPIQTGQNQLRTGCKIEINRRLQPLL